MKSIAQFFTLYWCIYFPTCIAFNDLPGFSSVDEMMTVVLMGYTFMHYGMKRITNTKPWKEYFTFLWILAFFTIYSLFFGVNVSGAVWLDFIQEIRPFSIIYCTWILNPQFNNKQKKMMRMSMVITLFAWIAMHPTGVQIDENGNIVRQEFPVLGQVAICTGMAWYLFTKETRRNMYIALVLVFTGLIAPKFKFLGEVVCFIYLLFFLKKRLNFKSPKTAVSLGLLMAVVLFVTWSKFDVYYVSGFTRDDRMARPETYKTALLILKDYFPFGSGMGSFACNGAWKYYSPLYYKYNLNTVWGLDPGGGFICDAYYPTLAQFGIVGVFFFVVFWKRRLKAFNKIVDMRYYRIAWMAFFCLAIEQTADSSWLSGKGMGYCMLIALCLNANRNLVKKEIEVANGSIGNLTLSNGHER